MNFQTKYLLVFTLAIIVLHVSGFSLNPEKQLNQYIPDVWEIEQGLPQNTVNTIIQTKDGYIWFGTHEGVVRFDGKRFKVYDKRNTPQLLDNVINVLCEDRGGNLWIGGYIGGLTCYRDGRFTSIKEGQRGLTSAKIWALHSDEEGVWVGTEDGLFLMKDGKFTGYPSPGSGISAIHRDRRGRVWIGLEQCGLGLFKEGKFTVYSKKDGFPGTAIRGICDGKNGDLWISDYGSGLTRLRDGQFTTFTTNEGVSDNKLWCCYYDRDGNLWVGADSGGLNRFREGEISFPGVTNIMSSDLIKTIYEDREGSLWIGTDGGGLNRLKNRKFDNYTRRQGLANDFILSVYEGPDGSLWFGTYGGGLNRLKDGKFYVYSKRDGLSSDLITAICSDQKGTLWVGTFNYGLNRLKDGKFTSYSKRDGLANDFVYDLLVDREGGLWVSTMGGLNYLEPGKDTFVTYTTEDGLVGKDAGPLFLDAGGGLWIGTECGVSRFRDGEFTNYSTENGLSDNYIYCIHEDLEGCLWFGTSHGLNRLKNGEIRSLTFNEGLFDDKVYSVLEDHLGFLWMSCNKGIFMLEKKDILEYWKGKKASVNCVSYNENDGMVSRECNGLAQPSGIKTRDGKLWFATIKGVAMIDPGNIKINTLPPPLVIEDIVIENRTVPYVPGVGKITLPSGNQRIEINYVGLSFLVPDKVRFKYKLEGFDEEWQEVGTRRTAYYTKLSPGNYTFRVNACNNDGIWSEEDISLSLYLEPYFYQTHWFYLFCGCGILLLIFGIYGLRVRQLKKYKEELRMLVARRTQQLEESNSSLAQSNKQTAEAVNRSKGEFLALMSHEIRTPMNGIIGFTDMLLETQLTDEQQDYAGTISRSGEALTTLLNDILDFSRIEAGELVLNPIDFDPELTVFDIFQLVLPAIGDKHLEVICHIGDSVPAYVRSDAGRYRQVLFNLMTNAVKFTEAGEIILSLDVEEEQKERLKLHVKLEDTGIGIPGDKLEAIFDVFQQGDGSTTRKFGGTGLGLSICKKIACLLGGDVWAESTHGKGSIFHFTAWVEKSLPSPEKVFHQVSLIGKKVLLLDDNHNYLAILSHLLELSQMNVVQLLNPTQAVPVILEHSQKGEPFDLGIIDILMPEMSGFEVAKAVRALAPPVGNMPLLGFSSSTMTSSIKYREAGFNGFLPKPIRRRKLLMVVERLLGIKEEGSNDIVTRHSIDEDVKHSIHILLAEDNPINRKLTEFMLTKAGYRLTMVENGEEAVRVFTVSPERFDLIFMDIQMPLLNGLEATRQIRDKGFGEVPIIAMTAQSMKGDREKCIDAGMDDYISKPVKREKVLKMIKKWCMGPAE